MEQIWVTDPATGKKTTQRVKTYIPVELCGSNFNYTDQDEIKRLGFDKFYCPKSDYTIAGSYFSPNFNYLDIKISKCLNETYCHSLSDIENKIAHTQVQFVFVNTYFDSLDYESPIKYFLDDTFFWDIVPFLKKKTDVFIAENTANVQDDLF